MDRKLLRENTRGNMDFQLSSFFRIPVKLCNRETNVEFQKSRLQSREDPLAVVLNKQKKKESKNK